MRCCGLLRPAGVELRARAQRRPPVDPERAERILDPGARSWPRRCRFARGARCSYPPLTDRLGEARVGMHDRARRKALRDPRRAHKAASLPTLSAAPSPSPTASRSRAGRATSTSTSSSTPPRPSRCCCAAGGVRVEERRRSKVEARRPGAALLGRRPGRRLPQQPAAARGGRQRRSSGSDCEGRRSRSSTAPRWSSSRPSSIAPRTGPTSRRSRWRRRRTSRCAQLQTQSPSWSARTTRPYKRARRPHPLTLELARMAELSLRRPRPARPRGWRRSGRRGPSCA